MSKAKRNSLLFLSAAGVLVLVLAMSLPNLVLSPGQPFSLEQSHGLDSGSGGDLPGGNALIWIFRGIIGLALIYSGFHPYDSYKGGGGSNTYIENPHK